MTRDFVFLRPLGLPTCFYKINIRTMIDENIDVIVEADSIVDVAKKLSGTQITFVPSLQAEFKSFTIFTHYIKMIRYEAANKSPFDAPSTTFEIYSF